MKVVVLQSNYLPWRGYFDLINDADIFCFYDEVQYTKNDWRNRNKIYTKNGVQWLTIPVSKEAVKQKISEVKLKDSSWQELHFSTLSQSYRRAPFYYQLEPLLTDLYHYHKWDYLSELNQYSIITISQLLGIKTSFVDSINYNLKNDRLDRLINLLIDLGTTEYISGPSARSYLSGKEYLFENNNIKLTFKSYPEYPVYSQLRLPFEKYISVIDLIAHVPLIDIKNYI